MKICTQCGIKKPLTEFKKGDGPHRSTRNRCKKCMRESDSISLKLRKQYLSEYESIPETCACCGILSSKLVCDHEHNTERFRGFICHNCNRGIGLLGDNLIGLENAVRYLKSVNYSITK